MSAWTISSCTNVHQVMAFFLSLLATTLLLLLFILFYFLLMMCYYLWVVYAYICTTLMANGGLWNKRSSCCHYAYDYCYYSTQKETETDALQPAFKLASGFHMKFQCFGHRIGDLCSHVFQLAVSAVSLHLHFYDVLCSFLYSICGRSKNEHWHKE